MAKAHEVTIGADAKQFEQGVRSGAIKPIEDLEEAFDDAADAASDLGRSATRDLDKTERAAADLEEQLRDAQKQTERLERGLDDVGRGGGVSLDKVKDGAQEVQQEIGQNLGEAVSSIRGDLTDLGQVGQDTLGGLAATLASTGPAGIAGAAALAAGAVGLGLVTAELEAQRERAEQLRERLSSAYRDAAEAGRDYLDVSQIIANANDLLYNPDRADEWKQLQADAKELQLDQNLLIRANAGDLTAQAVVQKEIASYMESGAAYTERTTTGMPALTKTAVDLRDRWAQIGDATRTQAENAERSRQVTSDMLLDAADKAGTFTQAIDEAGNKLIALPDGTEFVISADTGQATEDVSRFGDDVDGVIETINGKIVRVTVDADTTAAERKIKAVTDAAGRTVYMNVNARGAMKWE